MNSKLPGWQLLAAASSMLAGTAAAAELAPPSGPNAPASMEVEAPKKQSGWGVTATYYGDSLTNLAGGLSRGATYQGRLGLIGDADLGALFGWQGASAHISLHQIHGTGITDRRVGALMIVTGIEAEPATRLFNLWIEQAIGSTLSIKVGQFTAGQEFVISSTAASFVNSTFGWPTILAQDLPSGGPAYPLATPGVRVAISVDRRTKVLAAVFNGDPAGRGSGDPQIRDKDGLNSLIPAGPPFAIAEVQRSLGGSAGKPGNMLRAGGWVYFGEVDDLRHDRAGGLLAAPDSSGVPKRHRGNGGVYVILDIVDRRHDGRTVNSFVRFAVAPGDRNLIDLYADAGVSFGNFWRHRPNDIAGIAIGYSRISPTARAFDLDVRRFGDPGRPERGYEALVELTYQLQMTSRWMVQPDVQVIAHPGGGVGLSTALVVGVRNVLRF